MKTNILYLDTSALVHAYKTGGIDLLNAYKKSAQLDGYKLVITDVVKEEVKDGPLRKELGKWLEANQIEVRRTAEQIKYANYDNAKKLGSPADYNPLNRGERSIIEDGIKAKNSGHNIKVFSDDGMFSTPQDLRSNNKEVLESLEGRKLTSAELKNYSLVTINDAQNNSKMLTNALEKGIISKKDYQVFRDEFLHNNQIKFDQSNRLKEHFLSDEQLKNMPDNFKPQNASDGIKKKIELEEPSNHTSGDHKNTTTDTENTQKKASVEEKVQSKVTDIDSSKSSTSHKPTRTKTKLFLKGAGVAGVAISAYEWYHEGDKLIRLHNQGNDTATLSGAKSFATEVAFTSLGAGIGVTLTSTVAGSLAGTGSGLASPTPPHPLVKAGAGVLGGLAGGYVGMKAADSVNAERISNEINTQKDHEGNQWVRDKDSKEWMRVASSENMPIHESGRIFGEWARNSETGEWSRNSHSLDPRLPDFRTEIARPDQVLVASGETAQLLNYKSTTTSYELGMAGLPRPTDPYSIKESNDPPLHLSGKFFSNWTKNLETGEWSRNSSDLDPYFPNPQTEIASPEKTIELEARSQNIIYENALNSPEVLALRYQSIYQNEGWEALGKIPQSLQIKANPDMLVASDGDTYTLKDNQQWVSEGNFWNSDASPKITQELNSTQGVLNEVLEANKSLVQSLNSPEVKPEEVEDQSAGLTSNPLINDLLAQDYTKDPEAFMAACIKLAQTPEAQALVQQSIEQIQREQVNQQDMSKTQEHEQPQKSQKIGF